MRKVMYIVVNQDLNMSKGKTGSMCAHAVFDYLIKCYQNMYNEELEDYVEDFKYNGDTIVILKAHEKDLLKWGKEGYVTIRDRGLTEVEPDSMTAVNLGIYDKDKEIPKFISRLRLL